MVCLTWLACLCMRQPDPEALRAASSLLKATRLLLQELCSREARLLLELPHPRFVHLIPARQLVEIVKKMGPRPTVRATSGGPHRRQQLQLPQHH